MVLYSRVQDVVCMYKCSYRVEARCGTRREFREEGLEIAKWVRHNGVDEYGRKTIVITEDSPKSKPYLSLVNKFQIFMMKVFVGLGLLVFVLMKIACSL